MDELFRWITVRAPQSTDATMTVALAAPESGSAFQDSLNGVLHPEQGPAPAKPWPQLVALAQAFQDSPQFVAKPELLLFAAQLESFGEWLRWVASDPPGPGWSDLVAQIQATFGVAPTDLMADTGFVLDRQRVHDSILALFIAPAAGSGLLPALAELARVLDLIARVAAGDAALNDPDAAADALGRTLLLPPAIFPIRKGMVKPVGIADLLVVRQHLSHYERTDLSHVENVMQSESKKSTRERSMLTEQERTVETESTETYEEEQQTDERSDLKAEVSKVLKEDLSVKAGVKATAKWDDIVTITAKADVAWAEAKSDSAKRSTEYARDVVARATSKVTNRVLSRQTHKVTELLEEHEEHGFTANGAHRVGLYQWLTKIYTAQIFNLGKRLLFDLSVPEPAAFVLDGFAAQRSNLTVKPPEPFTLRPDDLNHDQAYHANYYGTLLGRYGVVGFTTPPPPPRCNVVKSISLRAEEPNQLRSVLTWSGELTIPPGYKAAKIMVNGCARGGLRDAKRQFRGMRITVGTATFVYGSYSVDANNAPEPGWLQGDNPTPQGSLQILPQQRDASGEMGAIPVVVNTERLNNATVTVEIHCVRTDAGLAEWKLKVHQAIQQAYNRQQSEYLDQVQAGSMRPQTGSRLGGNPDDNRRIERTELKKAVIQILASRDLTVDRLGAIRDDPPPAVPPSPPPANPRTYPRPDVPLTQEQGRFIRFFEQAFEWENITYLFYPYFWGRATTWYDLSLLEHEDPVFGEFLRAGSARVVVPVRPGFEPAVQYFLLTDQIWSGGDLPGIADADYLPIAEEIKAATALPTGGDAVGAPWQVRVPTTLIRLRDDASLPTWTHLGNWEWSSS